LQVAFGPLPTYPRLVDAAITIRSETPTDAQTIAELVTRAYADVAYSDHREHLMIERLRGGVDFVPELSLLAEVRGEAVGHILLTKARIGERTAAAATLALAPLSIVPEYRGRGVGKLLVRSAHARAADIGFKTILLVGIPSYYPQFGYRRLSGYPITLPFDAPEENCMILPLAPGALDDVAGRVHYAEGWLDH
jgi:predicted N-acetyltransferase YhbS